MLGVQLADVSTRCSSHPQILFCKVSFWATYMYLSNIFVFVHLAADDPGLDMFLEEEPW